jgi:hypothetical protein
LLVQADRLVGGKDAVLVIDDTAMPKKGDRSVAVAPRYASSLSKTANCQTLVSLTPARGEVPVMVALRLFVPESSTSNPVRLKRAGVPVEHRAARTKPEIALAEIDRVIAPMCVSAVCLPIQGTAPAGLSARLSASAVCCGRWVCRGARTSIPPTLPWSSPSRRPESPANTTSLISHRSLLKRYWPKANGKGSAGGGAPKVG